MRLMRRHQMCRPIHAVKHEAVLVTLLKNTYLKHGERKLHVLYLSHSGANVPGSESSM